MLLLKKITNSTDSGDAKFSGYFWNTYVINCQCFFSLDNCSFKIFKTFFENLGTCSLKEIHDFFYKHRFFSTQPQCCLTFPWMSFKCCLGVAWYIWYKHHHTETLFIFTIFGPCLDLGGFMLYLCNLFFIFIVILIMINRIIWWLQTHLFFCLFFRVCPIIFGCQRGWRMWIISK